MNYTVAEGITCVQFPFVQSRVIETYMPSFFRQLSRWEKNEQYAEHRKNWFFKICKAAACRLSPSKVHITAEQTSIFFCPSSTIFIKKTKKHLHVHQHLPLLR